jgi:hypothetical protein
LPRITPSEFEEGFIDGDSFQDNYYDNQKTQKSGLDWLVKYVILINLSQQKVLTLAFPLALNQ